jgi:ribonucleotide monophosphatase NagD (HAD superfamily)
VLAAVETAVGRGADRTVGKPEAPMYETALDRLGPGRALAVGDRLEIDVAGARAAGIDGALVLTGGTTRDQAEAADPPPTHVAASLAALVLG